MAVKRSGLGKGLDSLIPVAPSKKEETGENKGGITTVKIEKVEPNRNQPRKYFNEEKLEELAESIKINGIVEPLLVQKKDDYYEIVAGERRWRAAKKAGLGEVPVIIKELTDQQVFEISLIENIQREQLNPIEEALAFKRLLEEFSLTQEEIAKRVSKSRSVIANSMRLLKLDDRVQQMVISGELSIGHARAILVIEDNEKQIEYAQNAVKNNLTVRDVEKEMKSMSNKKAEKQKIPSKIDDQTVAVYAETEEHLKEIFGTKVTIHMKEKGKGSIEIEYYSSEQLDQIIEIIEG